MDEIITKLNEPLTPELTRMTLSAAIFFLASFHIHMRRKPLANLRQNITAGAIGSSVGILTEFVVNRVEVLSNLRDGLINVMGNILN